MAAGLDDAAILQLAVATILRRNRGVSLPGSCAPNFSWVRAGYIPIYFSGFYLEQWQQYFAKLSPSGGLVLDRGVRVDSVYLAGHSFACEVVGYIPLGVRSC